MNPIFFMLRGSKVYLIFLVSLFCFLSGCFVIFWNKSDVCGKGENKGKIVTSMIPKSEMIIIEFDNSTKFKNDDYEVYIIDPEGTILKRITHNDFNDILATWSPDGKKIAFLRLEPLEEDKFANYLCVYDVSSEKIIEKKLDGEISEYYFMPLFVSNNEVVLSRGTESGIVKIRFDDETFTQVTETQFKGLPLCYNNGILAFMTEKDNDIVLNIAGETGKLLKQSVNCVAFPESFRGDDIFYLYYIEEEKNEVNFEIKSFSIKNSQEKLVFKFDEKPGDLTSLSLSFDSKYFASYLPKHNRVIIYDIDKKEICGKFNFNNKIDDHPIPMWAPDNQTLHFWIDAKFYRINRYGELLGEINLNYKYKRENSGAID